MMIQVIELSPGADFSQFVRWKLCMPVATIAPELEQYATNNTMSAILFAILSFGWQHELLPSSLHDYQLTNSGSQWLFSKRSTKQVPVGSELGHNTILWKRVGYESKGPGGIMSKLPTLLSVRLVLPTLTLLYIFDIRIKRCGSV